VGFNDLATTHPELAAQAVGWDPKEVSAGSGRKFRWRCKVGHEWDAVVTSRVNGRGCAVCKNKLVSKGFNDLATTHPELAAQAVGWNPKKLRWRCELGHEWNADVASRALGDRGCPVCAGQTIIVGFNDLGTTHPELAAQAVGWNPETVIAGTKKRLRWRCELGHEWNAQVKSRVRGRGCPICSGNKVLVGFNDLGTTHPELAAQAVGWNPETVIAGSHKKLRWRCELGHEWNADVASRALGDRGCPSCSKTGFDPNLDGWLYFLEHDEWQMFQIGITNRPENRLAQHERTGWTVLGIRGAMDGSLTRNLETAILRALRRRGAVFANKADGQKFDGWTESWSKSSVSVSSLKALLNFVYDDDAQIKN
jgi:translation initiation factor IF-1